jgi:tetratricopeptide (TPR) repeat protein
MNGPLRPASIAGGMDTLELPAPARHSTAVHRPRGAMKKTLLTIGRRCLWLALWGVLSPVAAGLAPTRETSDALDLGYRRMYSLDFDGAERAFSTWQRERPEDPRGPVSEAARLLFSELHRLGILETRFFVDDDAFTGRGSERPDPSVKKRMDEALARSEKLAHERLAANAGDPDALFALALASGLRADYLALIEARNVAALSPTKRASVWAERLLKVDPDYADAYLATGLTKYIIGSTPAPVRWVLWIGGYSGDKTEGLRELQLTAEKGRYLAPFARLLLAIAYLRQGDRARALGLLEQLREEFPENPLYAREIARIAAGKTGG